MIITVTLNPALDKTMVIDGIEIGEVNRTYSVRNDIGGKGINVSKVLKSFETATLATGFLGGIMEDLIRKELLQLGIEDRFLSIQGNTRTNIKLVDKKHETNTDINEPGPMISGAELEEFIRFFEKTVDKGDIVVLGGGLPPHIPLDLYGRLTRMAKEKGAIVVVDAESEPLRHALLELPDIIKPNEKELASYLGKEDLTEEEIIYSAQSLVDKGIRKVLVSRGEKGSILVTAQSILKGKGIEVQVKSTVGAGDSMVAALVYAEREKLSDSETLAFAQATGTAAVATEGTKACTREMVEEYLASAREKILKVKK